MTLRFSDLNPLGRAIIITVAVLTFAVAAVSIATSYGALYAYARDTGLYSERLTRLWPLLLDGAFIVAQLAAILAGILRGSRGWPILTMLLTGALTVWFSLQHAGADPGRRLAAALPPVLMMLAFEIDIQIVRWVMAALGKTARSHCSPTPAGHPGWPGSRAHLAAGQHGLEPSAEGFTYRLASEPLWARSSRPPPSGKLTERTSRSGWEACWPGRDDQTSTHRGVPRLAGARRASERDRAGVDRRAGQPGAGGH